MQVELYVILVGEGWGRGGGVARGEGGALAAKVARGEGRWDVAREVRSDAGLTGRYGGLTPIEDGLTADEIAQFDRVIGKPSAVEGT